jgi:hypothetical protein
MPPSAAGDTPLVGDGVDRDEVEGEAGPSSSTDPASVWMREQREQHEAFMTSWPTMRPDLTDHEVGQLWRMHREREDLLLNP